MKKIRTGILILTMVSLAFPGCSAWQGQDDSQDIKREPLRIGVTPDYPPMIFMLSGKIAGVEADLARLLAGALGRPLQFVQMRWEEQIPALMAGKTDIIMSGMTRTKAREVRISFTNPYLKSGQLVAMRTEDAGEYNSTDRILQSMANVGVVAGTTGDVFAQKNFPHARRMVVSSLSDGAFNLKTRRIDLLLHDGPAIVWTVSENEAELTGHWKWLNEEHLAWGVRRDDQELLTAVNSTLAGWKEDGTLTRVLTKWLPNLEFGE